jgi:hypothetical protein
MRRFPLLVSLVAVGFGLAALYSSYNDQQLQIHGNLLRLGSPESQSHAQAAGTTKSQLWPLDRVDIALFLVIAVCLSLAGGAGIGGGAVLVPVFIMLRGAHSDSLLATIQTILRVIPLVYVAHCSVKGCTPANRAVFHVGITSADDPSPAAGRATWQVLPCGCIAPAETFPRQKAYRTASLPTCKRMQLYLHVQAGPPQQLWPCPT